MTRAYGSVIVRFVARVQAPLLQMYGLYVLLHGHYSPGGGFQAGAALAGSFLIPRVVRGMEEGQRGLTTRRATVLAVGGIVLYAVVGVLGFLLPGGEAFLDYNGLDGLPWAMPGGGTTRAIGSLLIEVGIALTVTGVIITLHDDLVSEPRPDEEA